MNDYWNTQPSRDWNQGYVSLGVVFLLMLVLFVAIPLGVVVWLLP